MKLWNYLEAQKNKITKDENGENIPYWEITEVVLLQYIVVSDDYQQDSIILFIICSW